MAVQEYNGGRQATPVVDDELQVAHCLVALVHQCAVLGAGRLVPVVHLVHHVRNF